jgi:hypothetical protein
VNGATICISQNTGASINLSRTILMKCGIRKGYGESVYFSASNATFEQIFGIECQAYGADGQVIYSNVPITRASNGCFLKMIQSTVLRCPGEENQRIFTSDKDTLDSCYFQTKTNINSGAGDYMRIEVSGSNFSDNQRFKGVSSFRALDAKNLSVHHVRFNNFQQNQAYLNGFYILKMVLEHILIIVILSIVQLILLKVHLYIVMIKLI